MYLFPNNSASGFLCLEPIVDHQNHFKESMALWSYCCVEIYSLSHNVCNALRKSTEGAKLTREVHTNTCSIWSCFKIIVSIIRIYHHRRCSKWLAKKDYLRKWLEENSIITHAGLIGITLSIYRVSSQYHQ